MLKKDAVCCGGSISGNTKTMASASAHNSTSTAPPRSASALACGHVERPEPDDDRHHHIGQHGHLQQLQVGVGGQFQAAARSPRNRPATTPAATPTRIFVENDTPGSRRASVSATVVATRVL